MLSTVEILLMPICFAFLFVLMLLYWGQTAFFSFIKYKKLTFSIFYLSLFSVTVLLLLRWVESGHLPLSNLYESLLFLSWSFLTIQAILQVNTNSISETKSNRKTPLEVPNITRAQNEVAIAKAKLLHSSLPTKFKEQTEKEELLDLIAVIFAPMSLLTYTFAFLNLPKEMQKATALVPALQSNWLMMHVSVMILSYAALISGCLLAITYLLFNLFESKNEASSTNLFVNPESEGFSTVSPKETVSGLSSLFTKTSFLQESQDSVSLACKSEAFARLTSQAFAYKNSVFVKPASDPLPSKSSPSEIKVDTISISKLALSEKLDNYSYRLIGVGFPLLTIGILSGAVWANSAWGSYWSWDPKETWALITWLFFAMYLHARITRGWSGKKAAIIATVAFFVVWFCFLGVNLLGTGLHSYGWFKK